MCKNLQKRAKTCISSIIKKRAPQGLICQKTCKNVQKCAKTCKNLYLKCFWTLFKNVHCQGPCILRPFISRPYCTGFFLILGLSRTYMEKSVLYLLYKFIAILRIESAGLCPRIFVPSSKKKCTKSLSVNFLT